MDTKMAKAVGHRTPTSLIPSWERSRRGATKSPETVRSYGSIARGHRAPHARRHVGRQLHP
jgi:hypothetical protein